MSKDFSNGDFSSDDSYELDPAELDEYARASQLVATELETRFGEGNPQPRLEPTRRVVELLGDVHRAYPVIHVAGTNGKTSTSRLIESILRQYGLRTGLFTSPHLVKVNERILLDGVPVRDDVLVTNWLDIKPYVEMVDNELIAKNEPRLTYFEVLTILGFAIFADAPVDVAVVEAGLGGEWDSTNVADGVVAVFTTIALDHTDRLGKTLDAIARTKSGIIKPSAMVVSAPQVADVSAVLAEAASMTESSLTELGKDVALLSTSLAVGGQVISVQGLAGRYDDIYLDLYGDHQAENAAVAIAAVESFLGGGTQMLDTDLLAAACAEVTSPGRLQVLGSNPTVLVDAAHNPQGAASLSSAISKYFDFDDITLVLAVLGDKDARNIVTALSGMASRVVVTTAPSERALDPQSIASMVPTGDNSPEVLIEADPAVAIEMARSFAASSPKGAVIVTGSITLVGLATALAADTQGWTL